MLFIMASTNYYHHHEAAGPESDLMTIPVAISLLRILATAIFGMKISEINDGEPRF